MSENSVGILGQLYEDRKTKKTGTLTSRDAEKKTLTLINPEGESFSVSYSTFRNNYRKAQESPAEPTVEETPAETTTFSSDADAMKDFIDSVSSFRPLEVKSILDSLEVVIDGIRVLTADKVNGITHIKCLPDMFTYSDFAGSGVVSNFHIAEKDELPVSFDTTVTDFGCILQYVKQAALELNLYGYTGE